MMNAIMPEFRGFYESPGQPPESLAMMAVLAMAIA